MEALLANVDIVSGLDSKGVVVKEHQIGDLYVRKVVEICRCLRENARQSSLLGVRTLARSRTQITITQKVVECARCVLMA